MKKTKHNFTQFTGFLRRHEHTKCRPLMLFGLQTSNISIICKTTHKLNDNLRQTNLMKPSANTKLMNAQIILHYIVFQQSKITITGHTQCFLSTSSSASHFLVKKGLFRLIISPAKKVVRVGYSCQTEEMRRQRKKWTHQSYLQIACLP